jgi:hypothetical protein
MSFDEESTPTHGVARYGLPHFLCVAGRLFRGFDAKDCTEMPGAITALCAIFAVIGVRLLSRSARQIVPTTPHHPIHPR